jgi:hypothetical protein
MNVFFDLLLNLIGSIHRFNFDKLGEIAVFNLGFNSNQLIMLDKIKKLKVYEVEKVHPQLLDPIKTSPGGRMVRGVFAWKPVVIKQTLEKFPYILYLDAGVTVLNDCELIFRRIVKENFFFTSCKNNIRSRITKKPLEVFVKKEKREWLLSKDIFMITAGIQGLSQEMLDPFVRPIYECSKDLDFFRDDGTSEKGFGDGRHDQTLFSLQFHILGLDAVSKGWSKLKIGDENYLIHIHFDKKNINKKTLILTSQAGSTINGGFRKYIRWEGKR